MNYVAVPGYPLVGWAEILSTKLLVHAAAVFEYESEFHNRHAFKHFN